MTSSPSRPAAKPLDPGRLALVSAYCADAEKLLLEDRFHEARKVVQQALRLAPNHAVAVHILGVTIPSIFSASLTPISAGMPRPSRPSRRRLP